MLTEEEKTDLRELLVLLSREDLKALAKTVTNTLLVPEDAKEAVSVILQYSTSVSSLLSRQKISKELIFRYLHKKKLPCVDPKTTKVNMVQTMTRYWAKRRLDQDANKKQESAAKRPAPSPSKQSKEDADAKRMRRSPTKTPAPEPPVKREVVIVQDDPKPSKPATVSKSTQSDMQIAVVKTKESSSQSVGQICASSDFNLNLFSEKFTIWFYNLLNNGQTQDGQQFGPEHFWPDNNLQIRVTGPNLNVHEERCCGQESAALLAQMRSHFDLYLNPNITKEGVLAQSESHGVIKITVCGTAHKRDLCVGFFEQSFMLIKDPSMQNNWRIKKTEMQMKTTIDGSSGRAETNAMALVPLLQ